MTRDRPAHATPLWRRLFVPLLLVGLLVPWTWALLTPVSGETVRRVGGPTVSFLLGKTLHVSVYATLAVLALALPLALRTRIIVLALLVAHGGVTEYLQQFVQRGSSWRDVGLDTLGVLLGSGLVWLIHRLRGRDPAGERPQVGLDGHAGGKDRDAADL